MLPSVNENSERESNPMLKPLYLYSSRSAFFTDSNKQLPHVKMCLNFLIVDLAYEKYIDLLLF